MSITQFLVIMTLVLGMIRSCQETPTPPPFTTVRSPECLDLCHRRSKTEINGTGSFILSCGEVAEYHPCGMDCVPYCRREDCAPTGEIYCPSSTNSNGNTGQTTAIWTTVAFVSVVFVLLGIAAYCWCRSSPPRHPSGDGNGSAAPPAPQQQSPIPLIVVDAPPEDQPELPEDNTATSGNVPGMLNVEVKRTHKSRVSLIVDN